MNPDFFTHFYGDQVRWFTGDVVNVSDPIQAGRVQVRVYGLHTGDETELPRDDLPWATVLSPITQGGTGGKGNFLGLLPGARVFGIFLDGKSSQVPMIMGSLPKFEEASTGGSNINPLAKGEQTYPQDVDTGGCFGAPEDPYAAEYPHNKVYETEKGHLKEYDDTPGAERIREKHATGTFYQMHPDGSYTIHVIKDRYSIIAGDDYLEVKGKVKICASEFLLEADKGDIVIDGVSLLDHRHIDTIGLGPRITTPPIKDN